MEKDIQRRKVIDVLRSMDVGAIEVFPIVQKPSVTNTLNARLYKEKAEGMAWKTKSDVKNMPTNVQNGKWHCNAAQVLLHCRCAGRKVKSKKRKK